MHTDRPWWTVDDAAQLLRVNRNTLYNACKAGDFPHERIGMYIRIPAEALRLTVNPATKSRTYHFDDSLQLVLDLGPIVPCRQWRNGGPIDTYSYEHHLYGGRISARQIKEVREGLSNTAPNARSI